MPFLGWAQGSFAGVPKVLSPLGSAEEAGFLSQGFPEKGCGKVAR